MGGNRAKLVGNQGHAQVVVSPTMAEVEYALYIINREEEKLITTELLSGKGPLTKRR